MAKMLIGVHGMANEPPSEVLQEWWRQSLIEGLAKNFAVEISDLPFQLVYWADLVHKSPLHSDPSYPSDILFDKEPYIPARPDALQPYRRGQFFGTVQKYVSDSFGLDKHADELLSVTLRNLALYYEKDFDTTRQQIRRKLMDSLQSTDKTCMLIAHSIGSIVAYEALLEIKTSAPEFQLSHFVTIGSPLGLPAVKFNIIKDHPERGDLRAPENITTSWENFADRRDSVAIDNRLSDDFAPNTNGVRVEDNLVHNTYELPSGASNPNKSYGYFRTPEFSYLLRTFLEL